MPGEGPLTIDGGPLTMTSREIAELTGKEHRNVLRDVKRMLEDLDEGLLKFEHSYLSNQNKEMPEYRLPKDLTICLVAGYDAKLRLAIIRRWEELEKAAATPATQPSPALDVNLLAALVAQRQEPLFAAVVQALMEASGFFYACRAPVLRLRHHSAT